MLNNNPSINPANEDSLTGSFRHIFGKLLQDVNGMLPAQVIAYDRTKNLVLVQPLIMMVTTEGENIQRAQIASIPVLQIGGGNFLINFNLNTGDLGWILANDRDISNFLSTFKQSAPNTFRKNNFADSLFIPNVLTNYNIAGEDSGNAVFQSTDGTVKISLGTNKIKIAAENVEIDCTNAVVNSTAPMIVTTPIFAVAGNITASGTITPDTPPP